MSLYNNVIRNVNREDEDDEDKLGYEFWNKVENAPVIKQIGNYFQQNNANIQAMNEYARSKENDNLLSKGLAWTSYGLEQAVGAPFQLIDMGLDEISDRTNIDKRSLKLGLDLFIAAKGVKGSKTGAFNKGVQTRQGINKQYNKFANIFKKPGDQLIDIKSTQVFDDVANLSLNDAGIARLLNPIFTAKELGLDPSGTTFYSMNEPNYEAIQGSDELTPNFLNQWQKRAKTGEKTYYFDITGHRILDVPGMDNIVNQTRYKQWLTQNLINRYNQASLYPDVDLKNPMNTDFYDSQDQVWRLVKTDQNAVGPNQVYIPTPLSEIDSRKMKSENSSEADRVLLKELMKLNVSERNALEKKHPWLIDWNSDTSGQNYHEHMIGLDETEFWKSAYGKSLGYKNNDVYVLDKGLGNIVFLNDPKFKVMKDQLAEYVTPSKKRQVYPGKKERAFSVKKFTGGKYKGLNAVIGYEADINSPNKSDLVIYAYDPSSTKNIGFKTEYTIPNYYSVLYTKKADGTNVIPVETREGILHSLVDSYLKGEPEVIVHLEDLVEHIYKDYGININQKALEKWEPDYGVISSDYKVDTSADEKIFKTTKKNEIKQKREHARLIDLFKNGRYKQLTIDLLFND